MSEYTPGTYVKGESIKVASSASEAVALVFEGYKLTTEQAADVDSVDYRDLQAQARALGIRANQSAETLAQAIAAASPSSEPVVADDSAND